MSGRRSRGSAAADGLVTEQREGNPAGVDEPERRGEGAAETTALGSPRAVTPGTSYENPYVEIVRAGIDDITIGFEMKEPGSKRMWELASEGRTVRHGHIQLGHVKEWGKFENLLDRQYITWSPKSLRLYIQAKLAEEGELTPLSDLQERVRALIERLVLLGIFSDYDEPEPFVTRLDVTADGYFENPAIGKALLGAMLSVRLPGQLVARPWGIPMTTVYHSLPSGKVQARCYCRAAKTGEGRTYSLIRFERQKRWEPGQQLLKDLTPDVCKEIWDRHFLGVVPESGRCSVLSEEALLMELRERVKTGSITHSGAERVFLYSKADQLGLAEEIYPERTLAERRREARRLGIRMRTVEVEEVGFALGDVVATYSDSSLWRQS